MVIRKCETPTTNISQENGHGILMITTDLNYWIKHPFEFSGPILKPEYL